MVDYPRLIGKGAMLLGEKPPPHKTGRLRLVRQIDEWFRLKSEIGEQPQNREMYGVTLAQLAFRLQEKRTALAAAPDEDEALS